MVFRRVSAYGVLVKIVELLVWLKLTLIVNAKLALAQFCLRRQITSASPQIASTRGSTEVYMSKTGL